MNQEIEKPKRIDFPMPDVNDVNQVVGMPKVVTELDESGRLVSKVVFEVTPLEKMNDGLKVDDFALEVLLQNGYELHRMDVRNQSFEQIDNLAAVADSLPRDKETIDSVKPYVKYKED